METAVLDGLRRNTNLSKIKECNPSILIRRTWKGLSTLSRFFSTFAFLFPQHPQNIQKLLCYNFITPLQAVLLLHSSQRGPSQPQPQSQSLMGKVISVPKQNYQIRVMSSKIKAAIRIRPFLKSQLQNGYVNSCIRSNKSKGEVEVLDGQTHRKFNFDYIFDENSHQNDVYDECKVDHLIEKALKGYHATIFAYGQTGSGKTYTMHGDQLLEGQIQGIIPKLFKRLFEQIAACKERNFIVSLSFLQIYSERVYDLLNSAGNARAGQQGLKLRWNKDEQFSVENLFVFQCQNEEDLMHLFKSGLKNRINASHKLNLQSSRSHSILTLRIESFDPFDQNSLLSSKIELVDLAGSERIGLTGTEGKQAKQSIDINKSLFTLRQVISVLADTSKSKGKDKEKSYVPYRDSKLTSILKQSIGGNSYCLMIACINPHDFFLDENLSTLTYATKASFITNKPTVNDDPRSKLISELREQIRTLTSQLSRANEHIQLINNMQNSQQHKMIFHSEHQEPTGENKVRRGNSQRQSPNDQFSQRLIESINMVRELLKSNKELREKLEQSNQRNDQKDLQIFELSKENQLIKEKQHPGFVEEFAEMPMTNMTQNMRASEPISRRRPHMAPRGGGGSQLQHHNTEHLLPGSTGNSVFAISNGNAKSNLNYWNSVQINQYYMNERGVDSVPTNFSRKEAATSHERRQSGSRAMSTNERRGSQTAKFNSRTWKNVNQNPNKFLSSYQESDIY